jgi:hypothetical protein
MIHSNRLTAQQQMLQYAMFTSVDALPNFPPSITVTKLCDTITAMVADNVISDLRLNSEGHIQVKINSPRSTI